MGGGDLQVFLVVDWRRKKEKARSFEEKWPAERKGLSRSGKAWGKKKSIEVAAVKHR